MAPKNPPTHQRPGERPLLRLDQLLLLGSVFLVGSLVTATGALQLWSIQQEYRASVDEQTVRLQLHVRGVGRTLSRVLSLTAAAALRDNDYSGLDGLVKSVAADNPLFARLQILDAEGHVAAGSTEDAPVGVQPSEVTQASVVTATFGGEPVFEYREPISYGGATRRGLLVLSYSLRELQGELRRFEDNRRLQVRRASARAAGLGVLFLLLGGLLAAFQSRRITRPLTRLTDTAQQVASGDLEARLPEQRTAGREVQTLSRVFNQMTGQLKQLVEETRQKAALEEQVQLARAVQETLLPSVAPIDVGPLRIAGRVVPADECGGDLWLPATLADGRMFVGLGDVTGHGLSTALIASSALGGFSAAVGSPNPASLDTERILEAVHRSVLSLGRGAHALSAVAVLVDPVKGELQISSGGHPLGCAFNRAEGPVRSIAVRGSLLGRAGEFSCKPSKFRLRPGDVYVWFSDGLIEEQDPSGAAFGVQRLGAALERHRGLDAVRLRDALVAEVEKHRAGGQQKDDITVVVVEHRKEAAA